MLKSDRYSPIAQSVEQVAVNHWVGGSSPSRGATLISPKDISCLKYFLNLVIEW